MVFPLDQVLRIDGHVIAQVVESEFVVGTVGDVGIVCLSPGFGIGLMLVNTVHRKTVKLKYRPHPFRVAFRQIIVDGHNVNPPSCKGIQKHGKRRYQGFPFSRGHFRDFPLVEDHPSDQLNIVMNHVPNDLISSRHPLIVPNGFITVDNNAVSRSSQITVIIQRSDHHLRRIEKPAGSLLDNRKCDGKYLIQGIFNLLGDHLLQFVNPFVELLTVLNLHFVSLLLQCRNLLLLFPDSFPHQSL